MKMSPTRRSCPSVMALALAAFLLLTAPLCQSFQPQSTYTTSRRTTTVPTRQTPSREKFEPQVPRLAPLEASPLLGAASSPIGSFLVLTSIVLVHEAGHYLAARSYGIKVEEFSIGFGPKLLGFNALGNDFNFRVIPLGGYVRFPENYNATLVQEQEQELQERRRELRNKAAESGVDVNEKKTKTLGYQIVNLLTFNSLDRRQQQQMEDAMEKVKQADEKKTASWWQFGRKPASRVEKVPVTNELGQVEIDYYDDPDLLQNRPWFQRAVVLSGGVVFNLLLAFSIYFGEITTSGLPQPVFDQGIVVSQAPNRDGAASGILRKGDLLVGINGQTIAVGQSPTAAAAQRSISEFISVIRSTPEGDNLKLSVLRGSSSDPVDVVVKPKRLDGGAPSIGVLLSPNFVRTELIQYKNPAAAVIPAAKAVSTVTTETAQGLLTFFGQVLSGKDTGGQQVSGPIGLIKAGSDIVATKNWNTVLAFAAAISINLGVVNAFPLPALDGGQLVFVIFEAVSGRKVNQRLQEQIVGVTILLLLFVTVSAALGDAQSLFTAK